MMSTDGTEGTDGADELSGAEMTRSGRDRLRFSVAFVLLGTALLTVAGMPAAEAVSFKKNASTLKFGARHHKAGKVYRGQKVHGDFQFINTGRDPVKILGTHNPCGCTISQSAVSRSYSPGQRGNLRVSFDTRHFRGLFQKKILLSVVAQQKQILVPLLISAQVLEDIAVDPPILAFTPEDVTKQRTQWVTVDFKRLKDRKLSLDYDKRYFKITEGKRAGVFGVQVVARSQAGWRQKTININNASPHLPKLPLMVVYQVDDGIAVSPKTLDFGPVRYQKQASKTLRISGANQANLNRLSVEVAIDQKPVPKPDRWVQARRKGDGQVAVTMSNGLDRNGSLSGQVILWADKNPEVRYIIPLYGYLIR